MLFPKRGKRKILSMPQKSTWHRMLLTDSDEATNLKKDFPKAVFLQKQHRYLKVKDGKFKIV
jgi:hypothetical protein